MVIINSKSPKELQTEERTALSILVGLRIKFGKEREKEITYTANDLYNLINNSMKKTNREKIKKIIEENELEIKGIKITDEVIEKKIKQSNIFRVNWFDYFGRSLTQMVLILRKQGKTIEETYKILSTHPNLVKFLEANKHLEELYLENLNTCVHSRYYENNTSDKFRNGKLN